VILVVDLEEKSTGDFSVSGGYSTSTARWPNQHLRAQFPRPRHVRESGGPVRPVRPRAARCRFIEPYLLDYRVSPAVSTCSIASSFANSYVSYNTKTMGFSPRLGFGLREDLSLQLRYSLYQTSVTLPAALNNCNNLFRATRWVRVSSRRRLTSIRCWAASIRRQFSASPEFPAVWATANRRSRSARNWRADRPEPRWSDTRSTSIRSTTTRTRPTACCSTSGRILQASAAT